MKTSSGVFFSGTNASLHLGHIFSFSNGMEMSWEHHVTDRFEFVVGIDLSDTETKRTTIIVGIDLSDTETMRMIDVADQCIGRK